MKILVLTVGGSCTPIVTSIKQNKPDKIYFLCSDDTKTLKGSYSTVNGSGYVCGQDPKKPDMPNILTQASVSEGKYEIVKITDFDELNSCYEHSLNIIGQMRNEFTDADIIADYTGGTKSMSAGLAAASMDVNNITICLTKGARTNLVKVQNGTQYIRLIHANEAFFRRQLELMDRLSERYDYDGVLSALNKIIESENVPPELDKLLGNRRVFSKGFLTWDCFDHAEAWRLLSPHKKQMLDNIKFLETVAWSRKAIDTDFNKKPIEMLSKSPKGHGYELVEDLLLNSERRALQGRYDDAVGRLYRALELLVQIRLKLGYEIETSGVYLEKIPKEYREEYEPKNNPNNNGIKLGLKESYDLLVKLNKDDPLARVYLNRRNEMSSRLEVRNMSLFAHGFQPVTEEEYHRFHTFFEDFFDEFFTDLDVKRYAERCQFPQQL